MSIIRRETKHLWNPFDDLREASQRLDRWFAGQPGVDGSGQSLKLLDWSPAVNVSETDKSYLVKADLPEVKKEDIKVTRSDGMLTISGERKHEKREQTERFHRVESSYGRFERSFTLPEDADADHVEATYKDGSLNLVIPKAASKAPKAREIKVT